MSIIKNNLIKIARGDIIDNFYDLDTIIKMICKIEDDNKYDVLIHRFFEDERNNECIPKGWFCHIRVYNYNEEEDCWDINREESVKVFGCISPKQSVIKALELLFKNEI